MLTLELHPYCEMFPPMSGQELAALRESIAKNGVRDPIIVLVEADNLSRPIANCPIIDGRHRYQICQELGIDDPPVLRKFFEDDAALLDYVMDRNLNRRHLEKGQWAAMAVNFLDLYRELAKQRQSATLKQNADSAELRERDEDTGKATELLAERFPVSPRTIESAVAAKEKGVPELFALLEEGKISASLAEQVAKLTELQQEAFLEQVEAGGKPAEVFAALKRETESARMVHELLDEPPPPSQFEATPLPTFTSFNHFVDEGAIAFLSHAESDPKTGTIFPPVTIDGMEWTCLSVTRNVATGYDTAVCYRVMKLDDYIDAHFQEENSLKPVLIHQWTSDVEHNRRSAEDLTALKVQTKPYVGFYVLTGEMRTFTCTHNEMRTEQLSEVDLEEEADPYYAKAAIPQGIQRGKVPEGMEHPTKAQVHLAVIPNIDEALQISSADLSDLQPGDPLLVRSGLSEQGSNNKELRAWISKHHDDPPADVDVANYRWLPATFHGLSEKGLVRAYYHHINNSWNTFSPECVRAIPLPDEDATDKAAPIEPYSLATYDREKLPMLIVEFAELLHGKFIETLLEAGWDEMQPFLPDLEDLNDDIPTFWEQTLSAMAKHIVEQQRTPAVPISARANALLLKLAERRGTSKDAFLDMLIVQRAEQSGIEVEEVAA